MKKNLLYIFALMFALAVLSSVNVLAALNFTSSFGTVANSGTVVFPAHPVILEDTDLGYRFNISINNTASAQNVSSVRITLPSQLSFVIDTNGTNPYWNFSSVGQILTWKNTSKIGFNLSQDTTSGTWINGSFLFNVSATSPVNTAEIEVAVRYNEDNGAATLPDWNITTMYITVVPRFTATNLTELEFNEDAITTITLNINNSNIANYPIADSVFYQNTSIKNISIELSSSSLVIGSEGSGTGNTSTSIAKSPIFTRANATQVFWNSTSMDWLINSSQNATFSFKINATTPGNYTILVKIYFNESFTNITTLASTLQIKDATIPENVTLTCLPAVIYQGETETCTCTAQDNYYTASTGLVTSIDTIVTTSTGTHTQTCTATDGNGNVGATATATFYVNAQSDTITISSGGAGSGYTGETTHNVGTLSATTEKTTASEAQENIKFKTSSGTTAGTIFVGTIDEVTSTSAKLTLQLASGTNKAITVAVGETSKVDLDVDGIYDVAITVSSISSGKASLALKEISETVPASVTTEEETEKTGRVTKAAEAIKNLTWLWITLGIIIVIAGVIFYLTQKKGPVGVFLVTLFSKSGGHSFRRKK